MLTTLCDVVVVVAIYMLKLHNYDLIMSKKVVVFHATESHDQVIPTQTTLYSVFYRLFRYFGVLSGLLIFGKLCQLASVCARARVRLWRPTAINHDDKAVIGLLEWGSSKYGKELRNNNFTDIDLRRRTHLRRQNNSLTTLHEAAYRSNW